MLDAPKAICVGNKFTEINKNHLVDIAYTLNKSNYFMEFYDTDLDYKLIPQNML